MDGHDAPSKGARPGTGLAGLALLAARRWRLIGGATFCGTAVMLVVSLVLPKWYQGEVQMLAPKRRGMNAGLMMPPSAAAISAMDLLAGMGGGTEPNLLASILKSRTVTDTIIKKFSLMKRYDKETIEETRKELWKHVSVQVERKSSVIKLAVEDKSPKMARDMANAFAAEASLVNNRVSRTAAGQERRFLEARIKESREELQKAEVALKEYSERHKMLDVREQTRASIQAVAKVRGDIMAREVMLSYLSSFAGAGEQNRARVRREIAALKRQLARIEGAAGDGADAVKLRQPEKGKASGNESVVTPINELPELALEFTRLFREVKTQEAVFGVLTKQHEMAKLAEASNTANAQIIDEATTPTRKIRPKRSYYVIFGFLVSLLFSLGLARFRERLHHDPATRARWHAVRVALQRRSPGRPEGPSPGA